MKQYTVTQKGGYQDLRTFDKAEAETRLKEMNERAKDCWYICTQGHDEKESDNGTI